MGFVDKTATGAAAGSVAGPVGMVVGAGLGAVASIFGAKSQQKSQRQALRQEAKYTDQALADAREARAYDRRQADEARTYERGQYADYLGRLAPFSRAGQRAVTDLSASTAAQLPGAVPTMDVGGLIRIQAPASAGGAIREVPASQEAYWISKGATRVS